MQLAIIKVINWLYKIALFDIRLIIIRSDDLAGPIDRNVRMENGRLLQGANNNRSLINADADAKEDHTGCESYKGARRRGRKSKSCRHNITLLTNVCCPTVIKTFVFACKNIYYYYIAISGRASERKRERERVCHILVIRVCG